MYADRITDVDAVRHRRDRPAPGQAVAYNTEHGIDPQPLRKKIADILDQVYREAEDSPSRVRPIPPGRSRSQLLRGRKRAAGEPGRAHSSSGVSPGGTRRPCPRNELADLVQQLTDQMLAAARDLQFELAGRLRDEIAELKKELRGMDAAGIR